MSVITGCDWAWGVPSDAALDAAGVKFCARYLCSDRYASKRITSSEAAWHLSRGRGIVLVWEDTASRMLGGHAAGISDARQADAQCAAIGLPGCPVYFAADWDATEAQQTLINAYLDGAADIIGPARIGIYAGYWPASRAREAGLARYYWGTRAWSGGNWATCGWQPHIMQGAVTRIGGVECDWDTANFPDYGQWRGGTPPPPPAPPWPYPTDDYLGLASPDPHCHSGYYAADQPRIRTWQQQMARRGWAVIVDGLFGDQSDRVCRAFQAEKGLAADGKVGPVTWKAAWSSPVT